MNLHNKVIIITGAAGGIGAALAASFLRQNPAFILLLDINLEAVQGQVKQLASNNVEASCCDVSNRSDIQCQVGKIIERFGRIDLFCSNAGVFQNGGVDASISAWQQSLDINVMAHVYAAEACLPIMIEHGLGYFLHTISAAGLLSQIGSAPYTTSKHAALGFAEWLAITHGEQGIGVTALCPQGVNTNMLDDIDNVNSVASDGVVSASDVAECALHAIENERFLALPHPKVSQYFQGKAADHGGWIKGMQLFQKRIKAL